MKTLGIIGGIAPESTIEYYRLIIASYRRQKPDGSYPPLIINSINLKKMLDLIGANELADVTEYLLSEVRKLAHAGADFGLLAANTPHIVFEDIRRQSPIPLVSIVQSACEAAKAQGLARLVAWAATNEKPLTPLQFVTTIQTCFRMGRSQTPRKCPQTRH